MSTQLTGASTTAVKVSAFTASVDGTPIKRDEGGFVVTPPYSYTSAVQLPALPSVTTKATILFTFELLVETSPGSNQFFRQTVVDTLNVAISTKDAS